MTIARFADEGVRVRETVDTDLVERARRGDQQAFASLAAGSYGRLHTVAIGILRDRERAEDALQQALLTIWRELPRLRDPERFEAWSYRLLVHACYAEARAARRWLPGVRASTVDDPAASDDLQAIVDRDQLERGFRRLSVDHRAVVVLRYYMGLAPAEIADVLGLPVGTIHSRMHHALHGLRAALDADARTQPRPRGSTEGAR